MNSINLNKIIPKNKSNSDTSQLVNYINIPVSVVRQCSLCGKYILENHNSYNDIKSMEHKSIMHKCDVTISGLGYNLLGVANFVGFSFYSDAEV